MTEDLQARTILGDKDYEILISRFRHTLQWTALKLNRSVLTIRRMADKNDLTWSDGQILTSSIIKYLCKSNGKHKKEETSIEADLKPASINTKSRRQSSGWVKNW